MTTSLSDAEDAKLTQIFRDLFNRPEIVLSDEMTAADVDGWDSFNHINLVMMVEEEFDIRFSTSEISDLADVGQFKALIASKIN